ncbi:hypothetical protein [Nonomuraea recticatena]|uniref:Uncharacterized protein n=1 Tax=Nonomuraea recticatena TaxID=46178 RepID=A0ABN3T2G9_9ACTN
MDTWYSRLQQDRVWIDHHNHRIEIAGMEPRYARNALVFLERHAEGIALAAAKTLTKVPLPSRHTSAYDDVLASASHEADAIVADPLTWLASTPLVQALADRAALQVAHKALRAHASA